MHPQVPLLAFYVVPRNFAQRTTQKSARRITSFMELNNPLEAHSCSASQDIDRGRGCPRLWLEPSQIFCYPLR
jgi:hypothetical protein